ncbi:Selenocysteine lyase/Cysteine desulfurase [Fodinibius salinus]|uniref:Selenocysteine lyase/Cysteine desulfurase n=1 Tax=Fodinibius salinus TaxID=860790 RepID=A0A5D3YNM5_9BACT|nr:aminotransferase class V-fold PLP-dependent enzyme [Fodinibius salinus]TYP95474.1 Selenocysteine lyase/Cysteine desulfurase [Fodinibius salinus]
MDINKCRQHTPGTHNVIHFNNAGAALMPASVTEATIDYLNEEANYGGYETARAHRQQLDEVYDNIATLINAYSSEIALQENATTAWNNAFFAVDFEDGDRILTSVSEYASNYIGYLKLQEKKDVTIEIIPSDESGKTSLQSLSEMMNHEVKLVSITHIPTNSGLVNPVEEIGDIVQRYNCLYLVDGCQSVGHYPVDVKEIGCDMLSATGRKYLRGPRGTGFLYVNNKKIDTLSPPFLDLHAATWISKNEYTVRDDARKFENWESNYAAISGLNQAVAYANNLGINNIWDRIVMLADQLRVKLSNIDFVTVRDIGSVKGGIVTFTIDGMSAQEVQKNLSEHHINVSISGKSSTLLDMNYRNLDEVVRASVHYYNTEKEINKLVNVLKTLSSTSSHTNSL